MTYPLPIGQAYFDDEPRQAPSMSVHEAVRFLTARIEGQLTDVWIRGEVSNFSQSSAGHQYFTLKDENAQIACVRFKGEVGFDDRTLHDGMKIEVQGFASVYAKAGQMQFRARAWRPAGLGDLYQQYLARKQKLAQEGLFSSPKPAVPKFVRRVAVVSSKQAAGLQDVIETIKLRYPWIQGQLFHALVQGDQAPGSLMDALARAVAWQPDVILIVRGGGSFEDLMAFNDEALTRAVAACPIPVIAGIGHETDETLVSLAASLQGSTPTAAAMLIGPDYAHWSQRLDALQAQLEQTTQLVLQQTVRSLDQLTRHWQSADAFLAPFHHRLAGFERALSSEVGHGWVSLNERVKACEVRLTHFEHALVQRARTLDGWGSQLLSLVQKRWVDAQNRLLAPQRQLQDPSFALEKRSWRLDELAQRLQGLTQRALDDKAQRLAGLQLPSFESTYLRLAQQLDHQAQQLHVVVEQTLVHKARLLSSWEHALSMNNPTTWQQRGWALVTDSKDGVVRSAAQAHLAQRLTLHYLDGDVNVTVNPLKRPKNAE